MPAPSARRSRYGPWPAAALLLLGACNAPDTPEGPSAEEEVVEAFEAYRSAAMAGNGDAAAALAASETLDYYEELRDLALTAGRRRLQQRRLTDQMMALLLRHMVPPPDLRAMDRRDLVAFDVDRGITAAASLERVDPGAVEVSGDRALLQAVIDGKRAPFAFTFVREGSEWKIDFTDLLKAFDSRAASLVRQTGQTEEGFLLRGVTSISGRRPSKDVWDPLQPRK